VAPSELGKKGCQYGLYQDQMPNSQGFISLSISGRSDQQRQATDNKVTGPSGSLSTPLLTMSTSNFNTTWGLSQEEQILHHYASAVKKDIEVYRTSAPGDESDNNEWAVRFKIHLVFHFPPRSIAILLSDSFRQPQWTTFTKLRMRSPCRAFTHCC
jgi:hypothetical protein